MPVVQWVEILLGVLVVLLGGGLVTALAAYRTASSAAKKVYAEALTGAILSLQTENKRLCERVAALEIRVEELEQENRRLRKSDERHSKT